MDVESSIGFMSQLEMSGANSTTVMSGLRKAMKNAAADGVPLDEALAQLQELVKVIEAPDAQIAGVEKELKKAMELLDFCRKELDGYENDFNRILNKQ
jgi:exodeoxyribonuclease VII small subunit